MFRFPSTFINFLPPSLLMQPHTITCPPQNFTIFVVYLSLLLSHTSLTYSLALECNSILYSSLINFCHFPTSHVKCYFDRFNLFFRGSLLNDFFSCNMPVQIDFRNTLLTALIETSLWRPHSFLTCLAINFGLPTEISVTSLA